jgi:WD40 repeat protein
MNAITYRTANVDGTLVATASEDRLVRLWDRADRRLLAVGEGHTNALFAVAFYPAALCRPAAATTPP